VQQPECGDSVHIRSNGDDWSGREFAVVVYAPASQPNPELVGVCRGKATCFDLDDIAMARTEIRQLDSQGEIYATVDESGAIIGTGTREVCQFLMLLANQELKTPPTQDQSVNGTNSKS
jgi:hypothetical protein